MLADIKDAVSRSHKTLAADALGLVSIFAMFLVALNLPALF